VLRETGLLPHLNAGVMPPEDLACLREVSVSQGLMLETGSDRLSKRGGPHYGSPDKLPAARLTMLRDAGEASIPFTTGLLIGIGETRRERIDDLLQLRALHERYGHLQEIIIQNFRAKAGTRMAESCEPDLPELIWTIAVARLLFGPAMHIQAPPNLQDGSLAGIIAAGINDWGGVSPVTSDRGMRKGPGGAVVSLSRLCARQGSMDRPKTASPRPPRHGFSGIGARG
jgi:FO synthase